MTESANVSLRYGTEKHRKILEALLARKKPARDKIKERESDFARHDELYDAYMPDKEEMKLRKDNFRKGEPDYYTIVIPYSYAALLTSHTYWTSVFLSRTPVLQYTARHGEPQMKVQAVEAIMDYQVMVGQMLGPFYHWMHDAPKYGYGVLYDCWEKDIIQSSTIIEEPVTFLGADIGRTKKRKVTTKDIGYVGNRVFNVHPEHFWPDWRVPLASIQDGEFIARFVQLSWNALIKGKAQGKYFNLDAVEKHAQAESTYDDLTGGDSVEYPMEEGQVSPSINEVGNKPGFEIIIELVPKDWKLGKSDYPEKWIFTVIDDSIIVEARPYARKHGQFPVSILQSDFDAYKLHSASMLDRLMPLGDVVTWLVNQHFWNVRAALGNNFIYDPTKVVGKDLYRRSTSKLIRLKESAYGTDIDKVIKQLPVQDVTRSNMQDVGPMTEMMDKVYGGNDNLMGQVHQGGRKTATEVRQSSAFGISRQKTVAEYWSATAFGPMSSRFIQNTQQLYDEEMQFKIAGGLALEAGFMTVAPETIAGMYDFVPVDGTMPVDRFAQANLWRETIMGAAKIPQIAGQYDIPKMFGWMAQLAGLKNINQFKVQVVPDGQMANALQQGNVVPMGQAGDAAPNPEIIPQPKQTPGVGGVA